jgi:small subunit ribosomal protein S17e
MGRIKTAQIKRITRELIDRYKKDFKTDFENNKKLVSSRTDIQSKKTRNVIAGYVTRIIRANKD